MKLFLKIFKTEFLPPLPGVWKNGPPHYTVKNENLRRGSFGSLNEAFWCTDYNAKNLSSLQSPVSKKIKKNHKNGHFWKNGILWRFFLIFSETRLLREVRFFALFGLDNSFLSALGPKLHFLPWEVMQTSWPTVGAHCGGSAGWWS